MAKSKVKLQFNRKNYGDSPASYRLDVIENAVTVQRPTNKDVFRVGDIVNEIVVQDFVESKRDFSVKVRS